MMIGENEMAHQLYEARLKEQRDNYAREQGVVKFREYEIAKTMLDNNEPIEKIIMYTGLSESQIQDLC